MVDWYNVNSVILGLRLRELAPVAKGGHDAGTRNPSPNIMGFTMQI